MRTTKKKKGIKEKLQDARSNGFRDGWMCAFTDVFLFGGENTNEALIRLLSGVSGVYECPDCLALKLIDEFSMLSDSETEFHQHMQRALYLMSEVDHSGSDHADYLADYYNDCISALRDCIEYSR